ncbi:MAG: hypothetical protein IJE05_04220 [Clostridia bacterium]|nr:hypothetical protein [Clostridia bacterium]
MEEIRLYDMNSIEFSELIDTARIELKNNNSDYKELQNKVNEIMEKYPNLQLLDDYKYISNTLADFILRFERKIYSRQK